MAEERRIPLLRDDSGQFVVIPLEFELSCDDAIMRKEGDRLIVEPATAGKTIMSPTRLEEEDRQ
ncbi:hypothetical protein [Neorhizobium galegae]|uniref:hypothetical protein n=1 Tax=Neorhizobium galegae TaxID=399 RepID=UPI000621E159|nr:hypothetical protein [Neorhizobium galegae]KAB1126408.1 AbrB/MazE/SpoVT family DNA-binding domain-containing protein [Neorhizobium galegae]MCQ1805382.1 AbrB/MazE/SpoVT family DNA-binding domain-containing protein [Neorhizobium galegae]CDZ56145.1 Hypothetical protein NGAL_HAMBI2566_06950 [Neorhizobium galegae bv. orientalis]